MFTPTTYFFVETEAEWEASLPRRITAACCRDAIRMVYLDNNKLPARIFFRVFITHCGLQDSWRGSLVSPILSRDISIIENCLEKYFFTIYLKKINLIEKCVLVDHNC